MLAIGIVFTALSCLVCVTNIVNSIARMVRKRKGKAQRGGSNIHVLSIAFSIMAYVFAKDSLGAWVFIPAVVDPAALFILAAPFLLFRRIKKDRQLQDPS